MISVVKNEDEIVVRCSNGEYITIDKIKGIVKTIKKMDNSNDSPYRVIIKSVDKIQFSWGGERFFERIYKSIILTTSIVTLGDEE